MLNTNITVNTKMNTPAVGIIQKSNQHSYFLRMHYNSTLAKELFAANPKYNSVNVAILQTLLIHENYIILEVVPLGKL